MRTKQNYKNLLKKYFLKIILISSLLVLGSCEKDKVYITETVDSYDGIQLINFELVTDTARDSTAVQDWLYKVEISDISDSSVSDETIYANDTWEAIIGDKYTLTWTYRDESASTFVTVTDTSDLAITVYLTETSVY
jgi:hypothetical protein